MKLYTVHAAAPRPTSVPSTLAAPPAPPVLLAEGFCLFAFLFGPLWFLWNRLWKEAAALVVLSVAAVLLLPLAVDGIALLALHLLAGFEARDRLRARLARRGMPLQGVVLAPSLDFAWFRLAEARPDLVSGLP
jgi:hypothetical protein